jgi:hypothetical protein
MSEYSGQMYRKGFASYSTILYLHSLSISTSQLSSLVEAKE